MANEEQLRILHQGVIAWDEWRKQNPEIMPDLSLADLSGAILSGVDLSFADLNAADLNAADLSNATCEYTLFVDLDLSVVKGLDTIRHTAPSTVGIDTLFKSQGKIPPAFLRACGVPQILLDYLPLILEGKELKTLLDEAHTPPN